MQAARTRRALSTFRSRRQPCVSPLGLEPAILLTKIEAEKVTPTVSAQNLAEAKALFMRGLLWWEWTIVSENSTGAHNAPEAKANLDLAALEAGKAKTLLGL